MTGSALHRLVRLTNMASADFCYPIPEPLDSGSTWQDSRSPRVRRVTFTFIPAAFTAVFPVQVLGFKDIGLLTQYDCLICSFCSSGQCFACSFLQIPPHGRHPCCPANCSPCRASRGLSPPSHPTATTAVKLVRAMPGTPKKKGNHKGLPLQNIDCVINDWD